MILSVDGTLEVGPQSAGDSSFPSMSVSEPLALTPTPKLSNACTGTVVRNLNSPSSFAALSGVGATDAVTKGDTIYIRANAPIQVRMTMADPGGGSDVVSIVPVYGLALVEFSPTGYLKLLEAKGVATISYLISGPQ